jgi:hypothetical protein
VSSEHVPDGTPSTPAPPNGNGVNGGVEWAKMQRTALVVGFVGICVYAAATLINKFAGDPEWTRQFFLSWLTASVFWLSLPVGCLAWLGITYVTGASYGVLLSRLFEAATRTLPLLMALFAFIVVGVFIADASPYPWSKPASTYVEGPGLSELEAKFSDWCNPKGFLIRTAIYFAVWGILIFFFNKWSVQVEQTNDLKARRFTENLAGPAIMCFALGNMFASTDFAMSLELSWFSTMFPLIYCINQLLTCLCFCIAVFITISTVPSVKQALRPKFQIDMGSMMLALTLVWSYMSFCQFLLVWVGNLPEEIAFFVKRTRGGWEYVSRTLCVLHFALPFLLLLFRDVKLHPKRLRAVAILIMSMCALDVVWWIEPAYEHPGGPQFLLMDLGAIVAVGGIWGWYFLNQLKKYPLLPTNYLGQLPGAHNDH